MSRSGPLRRVARPAIVLLSAWAMAAPTWPARRAGSAPIALIDVSASVGGTGDVPPGADVGGVRLLVADGVAAVVGGGEPSGLPREATRLGAGLREAVARWPGRDVWMFTDGQDTVGQEPGGDADLAARAVAAGGGRLFTSPPVRPIADIGLIEARVEGDRRTGVRVTGVLASSTDGEVRCVLRRSEIPVARLDVSVAAGDRLPVTLVDPQPPAEDAARPAAYEISLVPLAGTPNDDPRNDRLTVGLRRARRVVVIWGALASTLLGDAAESLSFRVHPAPSAGSLADADLLVVAGVSWEDVGSTLFPEIAAFVAGGGRLLFLGGPHAYAAGGWAGTPFEERLAALRVPRSEGRGRALVLALDRSGSTDRSLASLVRATREVATRLAPAERLAVLSFAATPDARLLGGGWIAGNDAPGREALSSALGTLSSGGGTDLVAAVRAALAAAGAVKDVRERRVLLLTDGDPDHPPSPEALATLRREIDAADVRFAALVAGDEELASRLRALVRDPRDVALLRDAADFPEHVLRATESMRREGETLDGPAEVRVVAADDLGLAEDAFGPLRLHDVEVVEGATLVAEATLPDARRVPFAAVRAVGAGRVLSLAFGPEGERDRAAATAWLGPVVARLAAESDRGLVADVEEGGAILVEAPEAAGQGSVRAVGEGAETTLLEVAPGVFRGPAPGDVSSGIRVRLAPRSAATGEERVGAAGAPTERALRFPALPGPEHRRIGVDERRLATLAEAGGGFRVADGGAPPRPVSRDGVPLAPWLLLLAGMLLAVDRAAVRRPPSLEGGGAYPV